MGLESVELHGAKQGSWVIAFIHQEVIIVTAIAKSSGIIIIHTTPLPMRIFCQSRSLHANIEGNYLADSLKY